MPRKGPATARRHHLTGQKRSLEVAHEAKACVTCGSCPGGYATCARDITLPLMRPALIRVSQRSPARPDFPCPLTYGSVHATFLVSQRTGESVAGGSVWRWALIATEIARGAVAEIFVTTVSVAPAVDHEVDRPPRGDKHHRPPLHGTTHNMHADGRTVPCRHQSARFHQSPTARSASLHDVQPERWR